MKRKSVRSKPVRNRQRSPTGSRNPKPSTIPTHPPRGAEAPLSSPWRDNLRRPLQWGSMAVVVAFCVYRFATFHLLPLDSPGTMHAMLWPLFAGFRKAHSAGQSAESTWIAYGQVLLFFPVALALLSFCVDRGIVPLWSPAHRILCSRTLLFFSIAACLIFWRFPLLLGGDSNVDEAEFTAAATKLAVDPVFFRSVDCNTSGPFNIFPLAFPAIVGLSPDYATSRTIALVLIFLSLYILHRALRVMGSDELGRIAILPAVGFFSLATNPDFVHYSSELTSLLLISLTILACVRIFRKPADCTRPLLWLGALVSVAFFSKMQSVPIVGAAALVAAAFVYVSGHARRTWRPILLLAAGFAPLQILNVLIVVAFGVWRDFWMSYIYANWKYGRSVRNYLSDVPGLASTIMATPEIHFLVVALLAPIAVSIYRVIRGDREPEYLRLLGGGGVTAISVAGLVQFRALAQPATYKWGCTLVLLTAALAVAFLVVRAILQDHRAGAFGILSAALLGSAVFAVYAPHQILPHYLELMIIPVSTVLGWLLICHATPGKAKGASSRIRSYGGISFVILLIAVTVKGEITLLDGVGRNFGSAQEKMALPEGRFIDSLTRPGSSIVVWGWRPEIYLSSGRVPATRDTNMSRFFSYGKELNLHYQDRFLRDLNRSRADLIVDALDASCCYLNDRKTFGFEQVPAINSYIQAHYVLVAEKFKERFYLRRDLAVNVNSGQAELEIPKDRDNRSRALSLGPSPSFGSRQIIRHWKLSRNDILKD